MRAVHQDVSVAVEMADLVVELQMYADAYFLPRAFFYMAETYRQNYAAAGRMRANARGKPLLNSSLKPVHLLAITGLEFFHDPSPFHELVFYDKKRDTGVEKDYYALSLFEIGKH
ncbi:MAG: hypothetical protein FWG10_00530 [Eubacteriaceae bacterium]|nr:hypothetical protein [Eubacteriaceae bacterium]